jgi:hypothetical protein
MWYERHIVVNVVIRKPYCCWSCGTQVILLSVLWYVRHIAQRYQQNVLCITTLTAICLTYQNIDNNASYVSQNWQQNVLRATTLTTISLTYHNTDNNMSHISQHWQQYVQCCDTYDVLLSMLWFLRHIVVSAVRRMAYCCHGLDTSDLLLSVLWYVDNNMSCAS